MSRDSIRRAAKAAAKAAAAADAKEGGVRHGAMIAGLIAKAVSARQRGLDKQAFFAELTDEERAYLGHDAQADDGEGET